MRTISDTRCAARNSGSTCTACSARLNHSSRRCSADRAEAQQRVGQRMLAEQRAFVHVHQQPEDEGHADADAARLVHVPEHQHQRQHVRLRRMPAQRQQVDAQRQQQRQRDEERVDRQQQLVGPARHDHRRGPFAAAPRLAACARPAPSARLGPRRQLQRQRLEHQHVAHAVGRARWAPAGCARSRIRRAARPPSPAPPTGPAGRRRRRRWSSARRRPARRHWPP